MYNITPPILSDGPFMVVAIMAMNLLFNLNAACSCIFTPDQKVS